MNQWRRLSGYFSSFGVSSIPLLEDCLSSITLFLNHSKAERPGKEKHRGEFNFSISILI